MKLSKNLMLAVVAAVIASPVSAAGAKKATKSAPAVQAVAVKESAGNRVVRTGGDNLNVRIVGDLTGVVAAPMNQSKAKHQNHGKASKLAFGIDETGIGFLADGKADKFGGLEYGLKVTLTMDKYGDASSSVVKDSYAYFGNAEKYGTFYLGNIKGAEYRTVNTVAPALGGLGSFMYNDWSDFVNYAAGINETRLEMVGKTSRASKLMFVSPRINGAQVSVSYTPNSLHHGFSSLQSTRTQSSSLTDAAVTRLGVDRINPVINKQHTDSFAVGVNYQTALSNGVGIEAGAAVLTSSTKAFKIDPNSGFTNGYAVNKLDWYRRVFSYTLGAMATYRGFELGVQWLDNGKSGEARNFAGRDAGKNISAALGYKFGEHKVALGYSHFVRKLGTTPSNYAATYQNADPAGAVPLVGVNTNLGKAKYDGVTAVYTQQVAEGLQVFGEYGVLRMRTSKQAYNLALAHSRTAAGNYTGGVPSNTAHAILTGLKINF